MKHFTLFELHQFIERVFLLNFEEEVWIEAEIADSRLNNGNYYFSLIEKNENGEFLAKASASIWRSQVMGLKKKVGNVFEKMTQVGTKVKILSRVRFHPRYGYSLNIVDIDSDFTMGWLYIQKQKTIAQIKSEGLFDLNKKLVLPQVIQKVAVISSEQAAGWGDFYRQIENNSFGYKITLQLFHSKMQGDQVRSSITEVMNEIKSSPVHFDIIVIVRGGGSSVDLSDFDDYSVAKQIAECPIPVVSGIGHDRDVSVSDMVSFASVKTPTAAAEYIVNHNYQFESSLISIYQHIQQFARTQINGYRSNLSNIVNKLALRSGNEVYKKSDHLKQQKLELTRKMYTISKEEWQRINSIKSEITLFNPIKIMARGYSMIHQKGKWIKNLHSLEKDKKFSLRMNKDKIDIND